MPAVSRLRRVTPGVVAVLGAALVVAAFVRAASRVSEPGAHAVMVGVYSPFRLAYLAALLALAAGLFAARRAGGPRFGPATALAGLGIVVAAAACLAGYVDAVVLSDWSLVRLPPTEETGNPLATALSLVRVTFVVAAALVAGLALVAASARTRGAPALSSAAAAARATALAVRAALTTMGAWASCHVAVAIAVVAVLVTAAKVAAFRFHAGDVAIFSIVGRLVLDGRLPYRDVWDIKFPAIYYVSAAFEWLERWAAVAGLPHGVVSGVAETVITGATVIAFGALAREVLGRRLTLAAALLFAVIVGDPILTGGGHMTEGYALLPAILAARHAVRVLRGGALRDAVGVGAWSAVASMVRPVAATPLAAFLVATAVTVAMSSPQARRWGSFARAALASVLGFVVPWAALLGTFAAAGMLADFLDLAVGFNRFMAGAFPATTRLAGAVALLSYLGGFLPVVAGTAVLAVGAIRRRDEDGPGARPVLVFVLAWAVAEAIAVLGIGRVAFHYMLQAVPAFFLLGIGGLARWPTSATVPPARVVVATALLSLQLASGYALYLSRPWATVPDYAAVRMAADYVRAHTLPDDTIFVAETNKTEALYYYAGRRPATRYIYMENAVSAYTRGRYVEEIARALEAAPPRLLIVDAGHRWFDATTGIERPLTRYVEAHYDLAARLEAPPVTWLIYQPRGAAR
jgi:hypothetical protein